MINAILSTDKKWLKIDSYSAYEIGQLHLYFTKKVNNWYVLAKKNPNIPIDEDFMNSYNVIPVGLWRELVKACQQYSFS